MASIVSVDTISAQSIGSCPLCGQAGVERYNGLGDQLYEAPGVWSIRECSNCLLAWLDPRPLSEDIHKLYSRYYTHGNNEAVGLKGKLRQCARNWSIAIGRQKLGYGDLHPPWRWIANLVSLLRPTREMAEMHYCRIPGPARGRVLDVGCGGGDVLDHLRSVGWQVTGVELDAQAVQVSRARGLDVLHGTIEDVQPTTPGFDFIILNHVLEHVPDPVDYLDTCKAHLNPDGKLLVVTPNYDGFGRRYFGSSWRGLEIPRHLVLYSERSLETVATTAGLVLLRRRNLVRGARFIYRQSARIQSGRKRIEIDFSTSVTEKIMRFIASHIFQFVECLLAWRRPDAVEELFLEFGKK